MILQENVPLAERTTLGVGGPARYFACCGVRDLGDVLSLARREHLPLFVLGGGSNVLVADAGFDGVVVQLDDDTLRFENDGEAVLVDAAAGVEWDRLVEATVDAGLGGLECLSGIPGRAGAAPIQNVGAYGQEVAETIRSVDVFSLMDDGGARRLGIADCGFGYRRSRFKGEWRGRYAVTGVTFRLCRTTEGSVRYPQLARHLGVRGAAPPLAEVRAAVLEIRRTKSMVLDEADPNRRSAGSFFLNPVVTAEEATAVRRRLGVEEMPEYAAEGGIKLSAAWLIERCGFKRGERRGQAAISSRHALALINAGGATAAEIVALAGEIRAGVRRVCGVVLEPEPVCLGFDNLFPD